MDSDGKAVSVALGRQQALRCKTHVLSGTPYLVHIILASVYLRRYVRMISHRREQQLTLCYVLWVNHVLFRPKPELVSRLAHGKNKPWRRGGEKRIFEFKSSLLRQSASFRNQRREHSLQWDELCNAGAPCCYDPGYLIKKVTIIE